MWAEQALQGDAANYVPWHHIAAASNALAGRIEKAQQISARLRQLDPGFCVSRQKDYFPFAVQKTSPGTKRACAKPAWRTNPCRKRTQLSCCRMRERLSSNPLAAPCRGDR
jgi:hypothetical protein